MKRNELSDAQRRWLMNQLTAWESEDLITAEQTSRILERYESVEESGSRKTSLAVQAIFGLAAFLFGLSLLLLIGFNWEELPRFAKLTISLAVVGGFHWLGFRLRQSEARPAAAQAVTWLACFTYGAAIWLIAQAYHLEAHYPDGVLWWAIGVLPFALALKYESLHLLYVVLLSIWAGMEVLGFVHLSPFGWFRGFIPNGAFLLPVLAAPGFAWCYWRRSPWTLGMYVPLLAWWVILQAPAWRMGPEAVLWIGAVGAMLILIAEAHPANDIGAISYRFWGVALCSIDLLILGSPHYWDNLQRILTRDGLRNPFLIQAIGIFALYCMTVAVLVYFKGRQSLLPDQEVDGSDNFRRRWFALILSASLIGISFWSMAFLSVSVLGIVPAILANALTVWLAIFLIRVGIQEERSRPFNTGVLTLMVWAFTRYIDLIGGAGGMLGAAAMFAVCGFGLLFVARFWSKARRSNAAGPIKREMAAAMPNWLVWLSGQIDVRNRVITAMAAVAQVALLVSMIAAESYPLLIGETLVLRVQPVDPRDLFRGDYVILNYDFNNLPVQDANTSLMGWTDYRDPSELIDQTVYVTLKQDSDGVHWSAVGASIQRPSGQKYLKGRITADYRQRLKFGIEAYFVQEGKGLELEKLRNARQLSAEVAVAPNGKAKLRRVYEDQ